MRCLFALLSFVAAACAFLISSPGSTIGWTTTGPQYVYYESDPGDPQSFSVLLVNQVRTSLLTPPPPPHTSYPAHVRLTGLEHFARRRRGPRSPDQLL